jgi:AcrR family transcriptional regulator
MSDDVGWRSQARPTERRAEEPPVPGEKPRTGPGGAELNGGIGAASGPLSRQRIVDTAVSFIDTYGPAQLTMRKLAAELGFEAMSLYRYVPSRDELLDAVVSVVIDEPLDDPELEPTAAASWQDFLARMAIAVRGAALAHPRVFPLVASRPPAFTWIRPPLRSLRWIEAFFAGMLDRGFSEEATVRAYRTYTSFLLGHLLLEVNEVASDATAIQRPEPDALTDEHLRDYPNLVRAADQLRVNDSEAQFYDGLDHLLVRLELLLPGMTGDAPAAP